MTYIEAVLLPNHWSVAYRPESGDNAEQFQTRLKSKFDKTVKAEVQPLDFKVGLKVSAHKWDHVTSEMIEANDKAVIFTMELTKADLRLVVEGGKARFTLGSVKVPSELEAYRMFLTNLADWDADGEHIVSESEFKAWNDKNPKAAAKPTVYKTYAEMLKKSPDDAKAFRAWATKNSANKKVVDELEKTAKLKDGDPARVKALKAADGLLPAYYKTL